MHLVFGTDGVRGDARSELTPAFVEALGRAAAGVLGGDRFAVGRDPRVSGPPLASAFCRGVNGAGGSAVDLGVVPTPTLARWCDDEQVAGAMVSASHNAWHDNGVKLFAAGGRKLSDESQGEIERRLAAVGDIAVSSPAPAAAPAIGHPEPLDSPGAGLSAPAGTLDASDAGEVALQRHLAAVAASIEGRDLSGLRIVVDAANGAAHRTGPECLRRLGAEVDVIGASPNGYNINDGCGSLHPESLQATVVASGADAGVAFDGDADRVVAVDPLGELIDGDQILAMCAIDRTRRGKLAGGAVVVTVMANLGLRQAMADHGIDVAETPVGDRHVLGALEGRGLVLGGEQSGHLIFRDLATTGDGLLTAVQLLDVVKRSGRSLSALAASAMKRMPQVLLAVPLPAGARSAGPHDLDAALAPVAASAAQRLAGTGRVLVRPSGTEPLVRVMVEAPDLATARATAEEVSAAVAEALS